MKNKIQRNLGLTFATGLFTLALASALPISTSASGLLLPSGSLSTSGSQIIGSNGVPVRICSVAWDWLQGGGRAPNDINVAGYKPMFNAIAAQGINCVRICTCDQQVNTNPVITSIDTNLNPDLAGL